MKKRNKVLLLVTFSIIAYLDRLSIAVAGTGLTVIVRVAEQGEVLGVSTVVSNQGPIM